MTILLALFLCMLLPGIAGGTLLTSYAADPGRSGALLTRSLACGLAVWLIASGVLARTVGLTRTSSWVTTGLLAVLSVVVLALPRCRALGVPLLTAARDLGAIAGVALLTWLPMLVLVLRTSWGPLGSTPWYYASLASRIAGVGHVPALTTEWGTRLPFLDDYHLFSTGTAMLLAESPAAYVRTLQVITVLSVLMLACGAALFTRALGAGRVASLAAVPVAIATGAAAIRLTSYRPEAFALGLTLLVVTAVVDWLRHHEPPSLVAGCLLVAALAQVHGIALLTTGIMLVASVVASWPGGPLWPVVRRTGVGAAALVASILVLALALGSASGTQHVGGLSDRGGLVDPTWLFVRRIAGLGPSMPPTNAAVARQAVTSSYDGTGVWVSVALVLATIVLLVAARRSPLARSVLVFTGLSVLGIAMVAAVFALGWTGYVPRRTGSQRLVQEATLLVAPYLAGALACVPALARRSSWQRPVVAGGVVALVLGGLLGTLHIASLVDRQRPPAEAVRALGRLHVAPGSVVLANAYTEGYLDEVMGAQGLLEGRAPYTFPTVLVRANRLLAQARAFYEAPAAHRDFLVRHHVDYLAVGHLYDYTLGTDNVFRIHVARRELKHLPGLTRVLRIHGLTVYRVDRQALHAAG